MKPYHCIIRIDVIKPLFEHCRVLQEIAD